MNKLNELIAFYAIWILAVLLTPLIANAETDSLNRFQPLTYTEPVSGTVFEFNNARIDEVNDIDYKKASIETPKSYVWIYSTLNPDNKQYDWKKLNEFDSKDHYGKLVSKEKLKNADGWIRFYDGKGKNGESIKYCVSLIRGNAYALYLVEGAYDSHDFVSPDIVRNTKFGSIKGVRVENDGTFTWQYWTLSGVMFLIAALSCLIVKKKRDEWPFIIFAIIMVLGFGLALYFWLHYNWLISLSSMLFMGIVYFAIVFAKSWDEFWEILDKLLKSANE